MIKIVHVINSLDVGGSETTLTRLLRRLDRSRFDCAVISLTTAGQLSPEIEACEVPVHALGMRSALSAPGGVVGLVGLLRRLEPDIVHTWLYHANLLGGLASRFAGKPPVIWSIRQTNVDRSGNKFSTLAVAKVGAWLSSRLAVAIITNAEAARASHSAFGYDPGKFFIVPNGFDLEEFQPDPEARRSVRAELGLAEDTLLVGLVARFDPQKDHQTFVRAAAQVAQDHPDAHFLLCGAGVDRGNQTLVAWIGTAGIVERCHLLGRRGDMARLTAALDVAVSSSFGEALPNAIGEAMACGVACVATDVGDVARVLEGAGMVVPARQPITLAAAIGSALSRDSRTRAQLAEAGRRRIGEIYSLPLMLHRFECLYERVTATDAHERRPQDQEP